LFAVSLAKAVDGCEAGYSNSRTCEISLSEHSRIEYQSIVYLVDQLTESSRVQKAVIYRIAIFVTGNFI
jgi:hypothetical protein